MSRALVVIDVQKGMFAEPDYPPHDGDGVVARIVALIGRARAAGAPVYFVQHDGGPSHPFHPGSPGFPFDDRLAPGPADDVTVKHNSSAFHGTDLAAKLARDGVDHLVVTGMQSEYCVDSTIRGAVERGYKVTLVSDAHSTGDTRVARAKDLVAIVNHTMKGDFATVTPAAEIAF